MAFKAIIQDMSAKGVLENYASSIRVDKKVMFPLVIWNSGERSIA
jgi:hypothetical protein